MTDYGCPGCYLGRVQYASTNFVRGQNHHEGHEQRVLLSNHTFSIVIVIIICFTIANDYFYQCIPDFFVLIITSDAALMLKSTKTVARAAMTIAYAAMKGTP